MSTGGDSSTRYCPQRPLPPYAFAPGSGLPHPINHPNGHSHGRDQPPKWLPPSAWRQDETYLYGVDLYNHAYFWEAHEAWEGLWRQAAAPNQKAFLKGLIQCAAACLHLRIGRVRSFRRVAARGLRGLAAAGEAEAKLMGLELTDFVREWTFFVALNNARIDGRPSIQLIY